MVSPKHCQLIQATLLVCFFLPLISCDSSEEKGRRRGFFPPPPRLVDVVVLPFSVPALPAPAPLSAPLVSQGDLGNILVGVPQDANADVEIIGTVPAVQHGFVVPHSIGVPVLHSGGRGGKESGSSSSGSSSGSSEEHPPHSAPGIPVLVGVLTNSTMPEPVVAEKIVQPADPPKPEYNKPKAVASGVNRMRKSDDKKRRPSKKDYSGEDARDRSSATEEPSVPSETQVRPAGESQPVPPDSPRNNDQGPQRLKEGKKVPDKKSTPKNTALEPSMPEYAYPVGSYAVTAATLYEPPAQIQNYPDEEESNYEPPQIYREVRPVYPASYQSPDYSSRAVLGRDLRPRPMF